jgi:hypothetical protein
MRGSLVLLLSVLFGCASAAPRGECSILDGADALYPSSLVGRISREAALSRLLSDSEPLTPEIRAAQIAWFEEEWPEFEALLTKNAETWWFKESKGVLGWREGVVGVDGCRIVSALTFSDDN